VIEQQTESMVFDDAKPWERLPREPSKSYAAFVVFRNLGATRTLADAYRKWKLETTGQPAGVSPIYGVPKEALEPESYGENGPANGWKHWRKVWRWDERATAWDDEKIKVNQKRTEEEDLKRFSIRREQRLALDEIQYNRILKLNGIIDDAIAPKVLGGQTISGLDLLAKTRMEQEDPASGKKLIKEVDALEAFDTVCERTAELEDRYFRGAGDELKETLEVQIDEENLAGVAEFRWVADPTIVDAAKALESAQKVLQETQSATIAKEKADVE
jgi:hypothetical protein